MIGLLRGHVLQTDFKRVLLDVNGVGYQVQLPLVDLGQMVAGQEATLFIHTHVREDALNLYGFLDEKALGLLSSLYRLLVLGHALGLPFYRHVRVRNSAGHCGKRCDATH